MRRRDLAVIAAGGTWPENPGAAGSGTAAKDPYTWLRIHNRGPADVAASIDGPVHAPLGVADPMKYWDVFRAGERRVRNIGKPSATEFHLLNLSGTQQAVVWIEYDTETIVDLESVVAGAGTGQPAFVELQDGSGNVPDMSVAAIAVKDTSVFFAETTAALGGSATFTGPWHDALNYNWFGAVALTDQTGTLYLDEADAATPTVTNLVAKQATAATDANAPSPPAAGQQARAVPTKTIMRFVRVRFINGVTAQGRLNVQSSLSPLN